MGISWESLAEIDVDFGRIRLQLVDTLEGDCGFPKIAFADLPPRIMIELGAFRLLGVRTERIWA